MLQAQLRIYTVTETLAENSEGETGKLASDLHTFYFTENSLKITENLAGRGSLGHTTHTLCKNFPSYSEEPSSDSDPLKFNANPKTYV